MYKSKDKHEEKKENTVTVVNKNKKYRAIEKDGQDLKPL
jgi:hypothetical protein